LSQIQVRYPIRNKSKSINTNLVNYQFEGNNNIKQEVIMMEFDFFEGVKASEEEVARIAQIIPIDYEITSRQVIFKINVSFFKLQFDRENVMVRMCSQMSCTTLSKVTNW